MKQDPLTRLFPPHLSVATVDSRFEFLTRLNATFNEIYADQIREILEREVIHALQPIDDFDEPFNDEIPLPHQETIEAYFRDHPPAAASTKPLLRSPS